MRLAMFGHKRRRIRPADDLADCVVAKLTNMIRNLQLSLNLRAPLTAFPHPSRALARAQ